MWYKGVMVVAVALSATSAMAADITCSTATPAGATCICDVRQLRPLQGAVGMEEVRDKLQRIVAKPRKERSKLDDDPIKVVRGPNGALFITDHHHGADAWRLSGQPDVPCQIGARPPFGSEAEFWSGLVADRLVRLADANGNAITPAQLPKSLEAMPDDPYRSLAAEVRDAEGFCRSNMPQKEFAEFLWADWLRQRPELPISAVKSSAASLLPTALALVRSPAAQTVPGYTGPEPAGFECPRDF